MSSLINPSSLSKDQVEEIEKLTARWLFHVLRDFGTEAHRIFVNSPDEVRDIAEDVTRAALNRLSGVNLSQRVYGTVDFKRSRYVILPEYAIRQALFVDSKAEKETRAATIQMSQTSMEVRQTRSGEDVHEKSELMHEIFTLGGLEYLSTTAVIHYNYEEVGQHRHLREARIVSVPNGLLQERYNPDVENGFWGAGRNAPSLGEKFRVRVNFDRLMKRARWRVQEITYDTASGRCRGEWQE